MPNDSLTELAGVIRQGLRSVREKGVRPLLEKLFGDRFQKRHFEPSLIRDAYGLASAEEQDGVPSPGLVHPDNRPVSRPVGRGGAGDVGPGRTIRYVSKADSVRRRAIRGRHKLGETCRRFSGSGKD